jgi:hypothetical protein
MTAKHGRVAGMEPLTGAQERFAAAIYELHQRDKRRTSEQNIVAVGAAIIAVSVAACASSWGWGGRPGVVNYPAMPFALGVAAAARFGGRVGGWTAAFASALILAWTDLLSQNMTWLLEQSLVLAGIALCLSAPRFVGPNYRFSKRDGGGIVSEGMPHFKYGLR